MNSPHPPHTHTLKCAALAAALLSTALLSACTGTTEPGNPVLLVVGQQDGAASEVVLIEDTFAERGATPDRFAFVEGSARALPAPAVAYDVVDRSTTRSELVVLSRGTPQAGGAPAQLTFFALSGLNPDNPEAFVQTRQLELADLEVFAQNLPNPTFCPTNVQVTQNGLYAAVLNNPQVCGGNVIGTSVDILDLAGGRLLERITGRVEPGQLYLNQTPGQDLLYYALEFPGRITVQEATMPRPGESFSEGYTTSKRPLVTINTDIRWGSLQDLGVASGGTSGSARLVALFEETLVNVPDYLGTTPQPDAPIATPTGNRLLIRDDTLETQASLILSAPQSNRFSYLPPPQGGAAPSVVSGFVRAEAAVIQRSSGSGSGFVYFASSTPGAQLSLFDLSGYREGGDLNATPFAVPEVTQPNFVTWVQSVPNLPTAP